MLRGYSGTLIRTKQKVVVVMKICICIGKLSYSGAENVVRFLLESFIKREYETSVLLLEREPTESENVNGLRVESAIVNTSSMLSTVQRVVNIRRALKRLRPDIFIIFNCEMAFSSIPATFFLRKMKTVVCERNDPTMVPARRSRRRLRDFLYRFADVGVYQTERIAQYFERITPNNFVIENPIRQKGAMCVDVAKRRKVFATVARLDDKQKNQSMMIRGFVSAAMKHPEYELHLIGDGPDRAKYEALVNRLNANKRVKFLGRHENPQELISDCRAFLLTSEYEGMPNALIEAMSIGLPCISTNCLGGGAEALIKDGFNGIIIDRNDEEALTRNIIRLMEDEELCRNLGENAFYINERLDAEVITNAWDAMFRSML